MYGWASGGMRYPAPQGPFYCGVGAESVYGRPLAEKHLDACIDAGLKISGINAEVMPGQWEFQIGPAGPLEMPDQVLATLAFVPPQLVYSAVWLVRSLVGDHDLSLVPPAVYCPCSPCRDTSSCSSDGATVEF